MLTAFFGLYHRLGAYSLDKRKTHVCNSSVPVHSQLLFHLHYDMLKHFLAAFFKLKLLKNKLINLKI
jgi:hypothetical protein